MDYKPSMKKNHTLVILLLLSASPTWAARVVIENPCEPTPWLDTQHPSDVGQSVGIATISVLDGAMIPYVGSDGGISSIRNTVSGDAALEVVSDTEMRAYGWCFSLNGIEPNEMPDQVFVSSEQDVIRWYFGYAHYHDGAWVSYCTPTSQTRPKYICD